MDWQDIEAQIGVATGAAFKVQSAHAVAGGDINAAYRLQGANKVYFVKLNRIDLVAMFAAEFAGLEAIASTQTLRVPTPVAYGQGSGHSFLVLEHIGFAKPTNQSTALMGRLLALMHQQPQAYFGWHRDNTIGTTLQINTPNTDWQVFWREQRLASQLKLAARNGYGGRLQRQGERLCCDLPAFFTGYAPQASLLHGDLWAGNAAVDDQGQPRVFDPACYFGDSEADVAMTELFGGFGHDFYAAYQAVRPLPPEYKTRKTLYNLYHILNHLNLFGGAYLRQAETMMDSLLAELA